MGELLHGVPWGELTAYGVVLFLLLWLMHTVVAALVRGEIVPAKQAETWQSVAQTEQANAEKLVEQNERLFDAVKGLQHLVESSLPRRDDD